MDILYTLGTGSLYQNAEIKTSIKLIRKYAKFDRIFVIGENPNIEGIEFIPFKDTMARTRNVFRKLCEAQRTQISRKISYI